MTGRQLIKWIIDNRAEDKQFEVQYRNENEFYSGIDKFLLLEESIGKDDTGWQYDRILL